MKQAQVEIKRVVDSIMRVTPGGEAFFDALDEYIRTCATKHVFNELLLPCADKLLVMSGKFGRGLAERIDRGEYDFKYILFNGGIRSGAEPEIARSTELHGLHNAVFVDDTIYGGRTYTVIKGHLSKMDIEVGGARVVYDGSPVQRNFVTSVFRFYDHYEAAPSYSLESFANENQ